MICHVFQTHPRDAWCIDFHLQTYLKFCDVVVVAVDSCPQMTAQIAGIDPRIFALDFASPPSFSVDRVDEHGVRYAEREIRQASVDAAMGLRPDWIVFGDTDEVPTPDAIGWMKSIEHRPQCGERYYVDWVNLWGDYGHAIGGASEWSFQNANGNKKCFAMQPGGEMRYHGEQHTGMEPGRAGGGAAPVGTNRFKLDFPKLLHCKYASAEYANRPESKLARHAPDVMLKNGRVVDVPESWLWPEMPTA